MPYVLSVDTGGTFIDTVVVDAEGTVDEETTAVRREEIKLDWAEATT
jgi:N-methylhydantoinase A/oxoprolinase/acetone carboxylase beta subunit